MTTTNTNADSNIVEDIFKTKDGYNECDHCQSVLSPAAYFVKLVETIEKYIPGHKLKERRPDLFELPLDCNSTNKTKLYLEIANEIMGKNLDKKLGGNALEKLAKAKYPFNLPANFPLVSIRAYLEKQGISLAELYKVLKPEDDNVAESLKLSPEEYNLIIDAETTDSHLKEVYGIDKSELREAEKFIAQTNIDYDKLEQLIEYYNKIKNPTGKLSINDGTIDNIDQALGFLHRFIRLANKLNWSFDELCNVLLATDRNEIDTNSLKEISRIKSLQAKLKKPVSEICKLYTNASISIEKSKNEEDANNAAESLFFLQGVKESDLKKIYGIEEPSEPFKEENFDEFIARTGIKRQEVERLLDNYKSTTHSKKAKKQEKISVKEQKFLHNFTQLAGQLKLLFGKLNTIIAELPSEFKLKDLVTNTDNSTILKKIWNISDNELISLVNYNDEVSDKIGKSLISEVHKQILLARLMNISTAEIVQILLQLNITDLNLDNIERIFELNNWLNNNSITIEQLNTLINSSALSHQHVKEINEIEEEIEKNQELEIRKRLDSLVSHAELTGEWKIQIEKILEESEIKKLKNREKLDALMNNSTLSVDCKTKIKGILEELKSKEKLDSLINDSTLSEEYQIKEIIEKTGNKKLTSKERLDALINDSTLSEKCKTRINEVIEERENLHNEICKHFNVSSDVLAAAHQFTEKQPTNLQLLRLESPNKNIVHDVGIIGNKAVFLGKSEVHSKNSVESSMREPRKNVAVATVGTKTIFFGGKKSENEYSRKIDIYDEKTKSWVTEAASEERDSAAVAIVGSKAIFLGGNKDNRRCSLQVDVYDNGVWTKHTASEARSNASVAVVGEKAIFFGGKINKTRSSAIDIYNNGEWVNRTDTASEARSNASVAIIDTKVIFFGGSKSDNQCSSKVDIYDSKAEKWTTHTVSEARENASVAVVDGKAIFFGGKVGQTRSNKIDIYDAKTEKWIEVQHVASEARDMVQVAIVNKQAIFFGGNKGDQEYSKYIDVYDGATDSWKFTGEISRVHNNVSVAVIGTKAIFFTKEMNNRIAGQVYIYDSTGYSANNSIAKNWTRRIAKGNEMHDGLLAEITSSARFSKKIDIYDNIVKAWKTVDVYKPSECTSIDIRNNKAIFTCKDSSGKTYEETYSIDLSITYDAMIEELLNNVAVFTTFKLSTEDIKSITCHSNIYGLKATWTEKQIKTLSNHKALQDAFSGNELTLSQYTEWLHDSYDETKVTEKIAQLTNWDKKILDIIKHIKDETKLASLTSWDENVQNLIKEIKAFEQCFNRSNHPIDSLLTIKSFMDMIERSTIDGKVLLKLGALHDLKADDAGWKIYKDTEQEVKSSLSYVEGVKEQLEDQKRNILANYMLNKYSQIESKNMRGLYAFLLIDVEMSDCSKISPLKAGLNSLQLYIHRCILGLEEGAKVKRDQDPEKGLSEEMWDLLDNYREWEATKKIALYPENYLNPTLRESATPEYQKLKDILIQNSITDKSAIEGYLKYFADFTTLMKLEIADYYHGKIGDIYNRFHFIARTITEPYIYYYRILDVKNDVWLPWQKIDVQISSKTARIIHAFNKVFIFWLEMAKKTKQIQFGSRNEDISVDDSSLDVKYIFMKVDGTWSEIQRLGYEIGIERGDSSPKSNSNFTTQESIISRYSEFIDAFKKIKSKNDTEYGNDDFIWAYPGNTENESYKDSPKKYEDFKEFRRFVNTHDNLFTLMEENSISIPIEKLNSSRTKGYDWFYKKDVTKWCDSVMKELEKKKKEEEDKLKNEKETEERKEKERLKKQANFNGNLDVSNKENQKIIIVKTVERDFQNFEFHIDNNLKFSDDPESVDQPSNEQFTILKNKGDIEKMKKSLEKEYKIQKSNHIKEKDEQIKALDKIVKNKQGEIIGSTNGIIINLDSINKRESIEITLPQELKESSKPEEVSKVLNALKVKLNKLKKLINDRKPEKSVKIEADLGTIQTEIGEYEGDKEKEKNLLTKINTLRDDIIILQNELKLQNVESGENEALQVLSDHLKSRLEKSKELFDNQEEAEKDITKQKKINLRQPVKISNSEESSIDFDRIIKYVEDLPGIIKIYRDNSSPKSIDSQYSKFIETFKEIKDKNYTKYGNKDYIWAYETDGYNEDHKNKKKEYEDIEEYKKFISAQNDLFKWINKNSIAIKKLDPTCEKEYLAKSYYYIYKKDVVEWCDRLIQMLENFFNKRNQEISLISDALDNLQKEKPLIRDEILLEKSALEKILQPLKSKLEKLKQQIRSNNEKVQGELDELLKRLETIEKLDTKELEKNKEDLKKDRKDYISTFSPEAEADKKIASLPSDKYKSSEIATFINETSKRAYITGDPSQILTIEDAKELFTNIKDEQYKFYQVYLSEIFFHIPTLIAYLLNQEQKFGEARRWYQLIFDPTRKGCDAWKFIPFREKCDRVATIKCIKEKSIRNSLKSGILIPYEEASEKKTSFEKYVIISYVDNLIDWGDSEFSKGTWESINQATMLYVRAWDLLGEGPKNKGKFSVKISQNVRQLLDSEVSSICKMETDAPTNTCQKNTLGTSKTAKAFDITTYCDYFCTPENKDFIDLWDRIEDRLYKIRHCLDIKGKRLELPLFQPPIDPRQLISAAAGGSTMMLPKAQVPHYRFKYMITYAKSIADTITQIGSELLSVLEKKDAEALNLLYNKQEAIMANLMTTIKEKAIEVLKKEAKALNESLDSAKYRESHYGKLIKEGWSALEIAAMGTSVAAAALLGISASPRLTATVLHLLPKIFGFSNGGSDSGKAADSGADAMRTSANTLSNISQNISTFASYHRRDQDWKLQEIMATHDVEQISYQIEANKINQANAVQDLKAHRESIKQIKEKEQFFRSKFTNQELYSWMKGELKSLYIKTYRLALEIAKQAEGAYQYEIDNDKAFIQPGHWNSLKEGLLSGQKLKFELEQLDKEYHDTNERRLEITKVISLKSLDLIALHELKTKGSCKFSFTEKLFDLDFPGHYARKIKDIKITVPAVVGPYENVHASLQQTSNQVVLKSDGAINAIKYLVNPSEEEQPETDLLRVNWKPNQEIAISKADQDSGLFELSFGDERYLPFEGTGAVSTWELSLPQATNRFDVSTISDVIIHLDYTALNGGEVLSRQVKNLDQIKYYQGTFIVNLSAVYPEEWNKFKQANGQFSELKFKLLPEIFPIHVKDPEIDLNNICIIPATPDISKITIKLDNYNWERNSQRVVNPSLTIGTDWNIQVNNADISKLEEIIIMAPYKATINW